MKAELVFGIRVKLECKDPVALLDEFRARSDGGRSPEYTAMADAVFAAKPDGFEVCWATKSRPWLVTPEGLTFVPLYTTYTKDAHAKIVEQLIEAHREIDRMRELAKKF